MCGITGVVLLNPSATDWFAGLPHALTLQRHRGPDASGTFREDGVAFGHCRLSIIDVSHEADQPMEGSGHVIAYNGEIFNYRELRRELEQAGYSFRTRSDTEVLLHLYDHLGMDMLYRLNGFFAFALYDRRRRICWLVRDRFGVKPLYYYTGDNVVAFASELDALLQFPVPAELDPVSLYHYLQLNYIPAPFTICARVRKLLPGELLEIRTAAPAAVRPRPWYTLPYAPAERFTGPRYDEACAELFELLSDAVRQRLVSDVPLGTFLSGGLDSSIITGLASRHQQRIKSFSIGFDGDDFFDETRYARLVAGHFHTDHTVISLTRRQVAEAAHDLLHHPGEPFADSSAILVYLLSRQVRGEVKVVLSGDGADELFGGYLKHVAEYRMRHPGLPERAALLLAPLLRGLPQSRHSRWQNWLRQLQRFAAGARLSAADRYWRWCALASEQEAQALLQSSVPLQEVRLRQQWLTRYVSEQNTLQAVLRNDVSMVLADDMLMKVDRGSMAHGLEVRTPFLDYRIVEFAFRIPERFKTDYRHRKKIVHDAFRSLLPAALYHRPKRGFEVPLHGLLTGELQDEVAGGLGSGFIREQGLFDVAQVERLKKKLFSANPGDAPARIWALLVFQRWWQRRPLRVSPDNA